MNGRQALAKAFGDWYESTGLNQAQVAAAGGPSTTTQTKVRQQDGPVSRQTLQQIDRVTGWPQGTAARILSGKAAPPTQTAPITDAELLRAIARRLGLNVTVDDGPAAAELPSPPG